MHEDSTGQFPKAPEQQPDPYGSIVCWENSMGFTCVEGSKGNETLPSAPETPIPGWMLGMSGLVGAIAEWWYTPAPTQLHEGSDLGDACSLVLHDKMRLQEMRLQEKMQLSQL